MMKSPTRTGRELARFTLTSPAELGPVADNLYADYLATELAGSGNVVLCLGGELGAGKTTFARALGATLGVEGNINSPTFNLLNQFSGTRAHLNHFDLYRLRGAEEAVVAGFDALWAGRENHGPTVHLVEWWQRAQDLLLAIPTAIFELQFEVPMSDEGLAASGAIEIAEEGERRLTLLRYA